MPKRKFSKKRISLINDLKAKIDQLTFQPEFDGLTYIDVQEALIDCLDGQMKWHRRKSGYRLFKGEKGE